ncbi:MAG: T9SS type A sorting domain-containing protein, partial [Chitinophagales bacterium]|nr:T9SS type A sorting domain-containing protein [Chitinophagales bacterium]
GLPQFTYYLDGDNDGYGKSTSSTSTCSSTPPSGYVANSTDCNDANASIKPGATELCNSIDDDCDNLIDEGLPQFTYYLDGDNDGYGKSTSSTSTCSSTPPSGYVANSTDCNDANASIKPGATELCNSIDDDCDNLVDEGLPQFTYYADADGDTYGNLNSSTTTCLTSPPIGYVSNSGDCNDASSVVNPGATEICNSIDDDCDNLIDEGIVSASITPSGTVGVCSGLTINMQANTGAGFTYQWKKDGSNISGATQSSYTTGTAASYSVKVSSGTCNATSDGTILVENALPTATISPSGTVKTCSPDPVILTANSGAGFSYQWSNLVGTISGATSISYTTTVATTYTVKVTDANTCTKVSAGTIFKNYAKASAKITVVGSLNICSTGSVTFNALVKSGYFYQWYKDDVLLAGATTTSYVATVVGVYKYLATTKDGCTKYSTTKTVTGCKLESTDAAEEIANLTLYPNPSDGNFVIQLMLDNGYSGELNIAISNSLGQIMRTEKTTIVDGHFEEDIDLGNSIGAGIYLIRITADDHVYTQRLIISK